MDRQNAIIENEFEHVRTEIPGPRTRELAASLRKVESRNVTYVDDRFPVFWESASGAIVNDVDGNRYIDLTAGFGVANTGHSNPRVAAAIASQASRLMHAMGDVHPAEVKTQLLEKIASIAPGDLSKTFLASTGAEAVEAALKTAMLATGKSTFVTYRNAYHGLSIGTLEVSGIAKFRDPFLKALPNRAILLEYPRANAAAASNGYVLEHLDLAERALRFSDDIAAVIVEPLQARGGNYVAAPGYLRELRRLCSKLGILLIFDEIYTGFGRTGSMFACEADGAIPDILCIGKAMANGFPISAAVASPQIMDAWPESPGEALHTSTYLGNPMACAAAIANIGEVRRLDLPAKARDLGTALSRRLEGLRASGKVLDVRGRGLMWGLELADGECAARVVKDALRSGVIVLQAGPAGNVLSITPPLVITQPQLFRAIDIIAEHL